MPAGLHPIAEAITEAVIELGNGVMAFDAVEWPKLVEAIIALVTGPEPEAEAAVSAVLTVVGLLDAEGKAGLAKQLLDVLLGRNDAAQLIEEHAVRFARFRNDAPSLTKGVAVHDAPAPPGTLSATAFMRPLRRA